MINPGFTDELMITTKDPTTEDLFKVVVGWLEKHSKLYNKMQSSDTSDTVLDYCEPYVFDTSPLGDYDFGACEALVNTGGSEGIYIDWCIKNWDAESREWYNKPVGTLKTLDETIQAYRDMGALAGEITILTEWVCW